MKKILIPIFIIIIGLSGYLIYSSYNNKKEITDYIFELSTLNEQQSNILRDYEENVVKESDSKKAQAHLSKAISIMYLPFLEKVKDVESNSKEIKPIHQIYIEASELQLEIFQNYLIALQEKNIESYTEANHISDKLNQLYQKHEDELLQLAEKNNIKIQFEK